MSDYFLKDPSEPPIHCIIWMHGLGADSQDMVGLAQGLSLNKPTRHVFLDAPMRPVTLNNNMTMRAWFDVMGLGANLALENDKAGILQSEERILNVFHQQMAQGFDSKAIFFAGFSQGGAMALFTGLRCRLPIGGIIALSGAIPLMSEFSETLTETPIFLAAGEYDTVLPMDFTTYSFDWLQQRAFTQVTYKHYAMEHSVCAEELKDLSAWINSRGTK